ncbi:olfactory receptor 52P1-like [Pleurodeles waltl]|uniref:olfactory receptor 52P1-like n=1 Tax=Pleurodeles waltl TaxID=8319 RepID=UPI003709B51A
MSSINKTEFTPSYLFLVGIPGLEVFHAWLAVPLSIIYIVTLLGNGTLLLAISTVMNLHRPMYLLIALLSCSDLVLSSSILPKMLSLFWFKDEAITFSACLFQMFLIHAFAAVESGILSCMAIDRFVAVCNPLRYTTIVTNTLIGKMALAILLRAGGLIVALPILTARLSFCSRHIPHSFCEHIAVAKLSCVDITVNNLYGLIATLSVAAMDFPCIGVSYVQILRAVLQLPCKDQFKAFNTCVAHVCVMSLLFVPVLFSLVLHRFHHNIPLYVHILLVNTYLLLPPVANPLIYGGKMKEIRLGILKMLELKRTMHLI